MLGATEGRTSLPAAQPAATAPTETRVCLQDLAEAPRATGHGRRVRWQTLTPQCRPRAVSRALRRQPRRPTAVGLSTTIWRRRAWTAVPTRPRVITAAITTVPTGRAI